MTTAFARAIEGIPVVGSTTERDLLFGVPQRDQRVQLRTTGAILRYTGTQWVTDLGTEFNVLTFLADPTGVVDSTTAIQDTINAAAASVAAATGGAIVRIPFGFYKVSAQLLVPASVRVLGDGQLSTVLQSSYVGFLFKVGTTTSSLAYGCAVRDLAIVCSANAGSGVWHIGTAGFELRGFYFEGPFGTSTGTAIFKDGGAASNIFSQYENVNCQHVKYGLHIGTSGAIQPTSLTAVNFSALNELNVGGKGIQIDAGAGDGHRFFGGNLEHLATAIEQTGGGTQYFGMRFEGNTLDVSFPTATSGSGTGFFGCLNLDTISDAAGIGYNNHVFVGCVKSTRAPLPTREYGPRVLTAFAAADIPLQIVGHPTQSGHYEDIVDASSASMRRMNSTGVMSGNFTILDEAYTALTLQNSWVAMGGAYATPAFYKDKSGVVHLKGSMKNGTVTLGTVLCTLPVGYRPSAARCFVVNNNGTPLGLTLLADGSLSIDAAASATRLSVDGVTFSVL